VSVFFPLNKFISDDLSRHRKLNRNERTREIKDVHLGKICGLKKKVKGFLKILLNFKSIKSMYNIRKI